MSTDNSPEANDRTTHLLSLLGLTDKTAVITGASQGLGAATARTLHAAGANVVINFFPDDAGQNQQNAERLQLELDSRVAICGADVCQVADVERLLDFAQTQFGSLDIVINNAGILRDRTCKRMTDSEWQAVIDTNLTGVFHVCRAATSRLRPGGRMVNFASISGSTGFFGQANYAAAKAGVVGLTKTLAREVASQGITVNAVAPGLIMTEMGKSIPEAHRQEMVKQIPLGRCGEPDEVANAVLFLCSGLSAYITGQVLHVNGGWYV